jgi:hypothetical protein
VSGRDRTRSTPATSPVLRPARGRRTEADLAAIRERIEQLMLQGLRSPAIQRALTGAEAPNPIAISERQVRSHVAAIERAWAARASREHLEAERAKAIAIAEETARTATVRSTLNARANLGVGYLNASIKAQELLARLRGLYAPSRTEISGPEGASLRLELSDHPAEHLDAREEASRLRQMAADLEAEASQEPEEPEEPEEPS